MWHSVAKIFVVYFVYIVYIVTCFVVIY